MGAYNGVSQFFGRPLDQVAAEFGYDEDNILILRGDQQTLEIEYPITYRNMISCVHHADRRTPLQYAQDLVASWLIEDYFMRSLTSHYYTISLDGADRNRKILSSARTSASSDFLICMGDKQIKLELMNDYTGFWRKQQVLHLRDAKYVQLEKAQSLFIAIAVPTGEFAIYDFSKNIPARYLPSHFLYGGKPAYELQIPRTSLIPIVDNNMERAIIETINMR